eukprot:gene14041-14159_t
MSSQGTEFTTQTALDATIPVVSFESVSMRYGQSPEVLRDLNFTLAPGSFHFLTGASGAGKSSLLKLIYMAARPSRGALRIFDRDISHTPREHLPFLRRRIGVVFQEFRLLDHLNAFDNVALPLRIAGRKVEDYQSDVVELLEWVGLGHRLWAMPILRLLVELNRMGATVVIASHDQDLVARSGMPVMHLEDGQLSTLAPATPAPPPPDPDEEDGRDGGLIFTIAVLSFLACIAVIAALAADRAAQGWAKQLAGSATVQAAAQAAEALAGVKGVLEARAMDRKSAEALLEPWLGKGNIPADLPLPQLVTVELDPEKPATAAALNQALSAAHLNAAVDDHSRWMADVRASSDTVRTSSAIACLLISAAAGAVIAFATRQGLAARREIVEVLHLCGAEDPFVARLFQKRFAGLAMRASAYGALAAAAVGAILRLTGGSDGFSPALPIAWTDLAACVAAPVLGAIVAAVSAHSVAMAILREQV